jgi:hypothetical protein
MIIKPLPLIINQLEANTPMCQAVELGKKYLFLPVDLPILGFVFLSACNTRPCRNDCSSWQLSDMYHHCSLLTGAP